MMKFTTRFSILTLALALQLSPSAHADKQKKKQYTQYDVSSAPSLIAINDFGKSLDQLLKDTKAVLKYKTFIKDNKPDASICDLLIGEKGLTKKITAANLELKKVLRDIKTPLTQSDFSEKDLEVFASQNEIPPFAQLGLTVDEAKYEKDEAYKTSVDNNKKVKKYKKTQMAKYTEKEIFNANIAYTKYALGGSVKARINYMGYESSKFSSFCSDDEKISNRVAEKDIRESLSNIKVLGENAKNYLKLFHEIHKVELQIKAKDIDEATNKDAQKNVETDFMVEDPKAKDSTKSGN